MENIQFKEIWKTEIKPLLIKVRGINQRFDLVVSKSGHELLLGVGMTFHDGVWVNNEELEQLKILGFSWSPIENTFTKKRDQ